MTRCKDRGLFSRAIDPRKLLTCSAAAALAVGALVGSLGAFAPTTRAASIPSTWSPDYVRSIAGTVEVDTAAECAKVVPLDYKGKLTYWYTGPADAEPEIAKEMDEEFWAAWKATYPNIETD